jgi:hypothetical protein
MEFIKTAFVSLGPIVLIVIGYYLILMGVFKAYSLIKGNKDE